MQKQGFYSAAQLAVFTSFFILSVNSKANPTPPYRPKQLNPVTTTVPFLLITPDSRSGGMGDVGCATSMDVNSIHWNPAKLGFTEKKIGIGFSYTPWLRALVPDMNLAYVSGYYKIKKSGAVAASLRYFSLGKITFTNASGTVINEVHPNEYALDVAYGTKLNDHFSVGGAFRYINSNLTNGTPSQGINTHAGRTLAADVSALYRKQNMKVFGKNGAAAAGLCISNIGGKIAYTDSKNSSEFIPINLRLGGSLNILLDDYNSITLAADINKLLVPTSPYYQHVLDSLGHETNVIATDANGNPVIAAGEDPNKGVAEGMFRSFGDAPGGGKEELKEIVYSVGLEYWYNKLFALRLGYFYEDPTKGDRRFFTLGAGIKYNVLSLDFSYLIPTRQHNPLENTLRFSLSFDLESSGNKLQANKKAE